MAGPGGGLPVTLHSISRNTRILFMETGPWQGLVEAGDLEGCRCVEQGDVDLVMPQARSRVWFLLSPWCSPRFGVHWAYSCVGVLTCPLDMPS
jgi:hypothetical protein